MAISNITKENVLDALKYIDAQGVPLEHQSTKYELVAEDGKRYPPKYVIAVANKLATGADISTDDFTSSQANDFLGMMGFNISIKQFTLKITSTNVVSTDTRFTMENLGLGDNYEPIDTYYQTINGVQIKRIYAKNERRNCNQTMPRIACQVFEKQIEALSETEKANFPICRYSPTGLLYKGIFSSVSEFKKYRDTIEYLKYSCNSGNQFVFYCWNIFSTIIFVQECLKRFGDSGDQFVLIYKESDKKKKADKADIENATEKVETWENTHTPIGYKNKYSNSLIESKNVVFRGAPGTGKSYLAKEIAADIVSDGSIYSYDNLTEEQKQQIEFVQFHPSYDYTDFVEGLRPKINDDGSMGFKLRDGIFKAFVDRARKNYENSQKSIATIEKELSVQEAIEEFFSNIKFGVDTFKTARGSKFTITGVDDDRISVHIPENEKANKIILDLEKLKSMLESENDFDLKGIKDFFGYARRMQDHSYYFAIYKEIKELKAKKKSITAQVKKEELKKYIFIIDEINRGEISKIFGELFFSIDPGYRGIKGSVKTQYANLHSNPNEAFYIPENVYIIGTMNDIDKSVDSFDFAMRRRFRFIELKADEHIEMLDKLGEPLKSEALTRMKALNKAILEIEDLNENYQIGAAYFLKLKNLSFDQLWTDYLKPLVQEYVRGMYDEKGIIGKLEKTYKDITPSDGDTNDNTQNQG